MIPGFYRISWLIVRALLRLLTRWRVKGQENIPADGPLLIVANHMNLTDPFILAGSLNRRVTFMAKQELFRSGLSSYLLRRGLGAFPVNRSGIDKKALSRANQVLTEGQVLAMFPEGSRSRNNQLQPALPGSALIAFRGDVPILPVGITGTEKLKGIAWLLRRPRVKINIGHPFYLPPTLKENKRLTKEKRVKLIIFIMNHIAELLPLEYRGYYAIKTGKEYEN